MIRINLVRKERKKEKSEKSLQLGAGDMTQQLAFLGLFLVTFAAMAFFWFDISGKRDQLDQQVREAQAEKRRLEDIKILVDSLEAERDKLSQRLTVLSNLKNNLRTPLHPLFFIYLAQQENPRVLLQSVNFSTEGGYRIATISGQATKENLNSFSESLLGEQIIADVDILSQRGLEFQIRVDFIPFNSFGTASDGVAEPLSE